MSAKSVIVALVADIINSGDITPDHLMAGSLLGTNGAAPDIVDALFAETRRKRPDNQRLSAIEALLAAALDELRLNNNGGDPHAPGKLAAVYRGISRVLSDRRVSSETVMRLAHAFTRAQLPLGAELQSALDDTADAVDDGAAPSVQELEQNLLGMAQAMGNDPFALFGELITFPGLMGRDRFGAMASMLAGGPVVALRSASLGFALHPDRACADEALAAIVSNGRFTAEDRVASRLRMARPWLAPQRLPAIDEAIAAFPDSDAALAGRGTIERLYGAAADGAGGSSIFALLKERNGRRTLVGALLKRAEGVADAWVHTGLTKREADELAHQITAGTHALKISLPLARRMLADALGINLANDRPPPFGLIDVCDRLGFGPVIPDFLTTEDLIAVALADLPATRTDDANTRQANLASAGWCARLPMLESWFESSAELYEKLLPIRTRQKRIQMIVDEVLSQRRGFWARNCAWAALLMREDAKGRDETWIDMALVARSFTGDTPLLELPLAMGIAALTDEAFTGQT